MNTEHPAFRTLTAGLAGFILGGGVMYLVVAPKSTPPIVTTPAPLAVPTPAPPTGTTPAPLAGGRPAVAPVTANVADTHGIVQRPDGMVFIHSGAGSVNIRPLPRGGWTYGFGYRPEPGGPVDVTQWEALIRIRQEREFQEELNLTPEQLAKFKATGGGVPCPPQEKAAVQKLFEAYIAAAPGPAQESAKESLLTRVRQTGDVQGPLVAKWLADKFAALNEEQRAQLRPKVEEE